MRPVYAITGIVFLLAGCVVGCMGYYALYLAFVLGAFALVILDIRQDFRSKPTGTSMSKPTPLPFEAAPKCPKCRSYAASQDTQYKKGMLRLKCGTCKYKFTMVPFDHKERGRY